MSAFRSEDRSLLAALLDIGLIGESNTFYRHELHSLTYSGTTHPTAQPDQHPSGRSATNTSRARPCATSCPITTS